MKTFPTSPGFIGPHSQEIQTMSLEDMLDRIVYLSSLEGWATGIFRVRHENVEIIAQVKLYRKWVQRLVLHVTTDKFEDREFKLSFSEASTYKGLRTSILRDINACLKTF